MRGFLASLFFTVLGTSVAAQQGEHVNPPLRCADRIGFYESTSHFTSPYQAYAQDQEVERSFAEMMAFCERAEAEFGVSGLSASEAKELYAVLEDVLHLVDGQIGFPSPDHVPPPVVVEERVALSERGPGVYGLYYWTTGCGVRHLLYRATVQPDGHLKLEREEEWSVGYPC